MSHHGSEVTIAMTANKNFISGIVLELVASMGPINCLRGAPNGLAKLESAAEQIFVHRM